MTVAPARPQLIDLPKIHDPRGNLTFAEACRHIPFSVDRIFWRYNVPGGSVLGGHANKTLEEFIIALTGSFEVLVDDGRNTITYSLNRSYYGLYVPGLVWRELLNFSTNAVALFVVSGAAQPDESIYHYEQFLRAKYG